MVLNTVVLAFHQTTNARRFGVIFRRRVARAVRDSSYKYIHTVLFAYSYDIYYTAIRAHHRASAPPRLASAAATAASGTRSYAAPASVFPDRPPLAGAEALAARARRTRRPRSPSARAAPHGRRAGPRRRGLVRRRGHVLAVSVLKPAFEHAAGARPARVADPSLSVGSRSAAASFSETVTRSGAAGGAAAQQRRHVAHRALGASSAAELVGPNAGRRSTRIRIPASLEPPWTAPAAPRASKQHSVCRSTVARRT